MDTNRLLHLLSAGDLTAWPDLARDLERRADVDNAAEALTLLHAQGHVIEAAQWLAHVTDTAELQILRAATLTHAQNWPISPLRALTHDLLGGAYRLIPAGSFLMGSPEDEEGRDNNETQHLLEITQHLVEITQPFLLKTTPVTQAEWLALMGHNPSYFKGDDCCPVEMVSWNDAVRFCDALSAKTGGAYGLPTEAQWEYACRAGTTGARYGALDDIAWYGKNAYRTAQPVAQKAPNAWGLYDMLGNVWEWTADWHDRSDYGASPSRNPTGPSSGSKRVHRGGSFFNDAALSRASRRASGAPGSTYKFVGFRPASLFAWSLTV